MIRRGADIADRRDRTAAELAEQELQPLQARGIERLAGRPRQSDLAGEVPGPRAQERTDQPVEPPVLPRPCELARDLPRPIPELVERLFAVEIEDLHEALFEVVDRDGPRARARPRRREVLEEYSGTRR